MDVVTTTGSRLGEGARLEAWVRASLNAQSLGSRMLALSGDHRLIPDWYERYVPKGPICSILPSIYGQRVLWHYLEEHVGCCEHSLVQQVGFNVNFCSLRFLYLIVRSM